VEGTIFSRFLVLEEDGERAGLFCVLCVCVDVCDDDLCVGEYGRSVLSD